MDVINKDTLNRSILHVVIVIKTFIRVSSTGLVMSAIYPMNGHSFLSIMTLKVHIHSKVSIEESSVNSVILTTSIKV